MNFQGKKILLFAPSFFSYDLEIKKKLESLGATVVLCDDRPSNNSLVKGIIRVNRKLITPIIDRYFDQIIATNKAVDFDYVFFVKGESASVKSVGKLKMHFPNAKFILYLWDSISNNDNTDIYSLFDKVLSFDKDDCKSQPDFVFRPLFYLDQFKEISREKKTDYKYLSSFVGTVHSDRYFVVKDIINAFQQNERKSKTILFLPSKLLFWFRKLTESLFRTVPYSDICFTSVSFAEVSQIFIDSMIVIDIQHPKQMGLTMRTIETLGADKKLITTNSDIKNYDFYNENNILIVERDKVIVPSAFLESSYVAVEQSIYNKYSIDGWIFDCFKGL